MRCCWYVLPDDSGARADGDGDREGSCGVKSYWTDLQTGRLSRRSLVRGAAAGLALVAGGGLIACGTKTSSSATRGGASGAAAGKPQTGGKLAFNVSTDPFDWDLSYVGKSVPNGGGQALAYESLLGFQYGANVKYADLHVQPELAQKYEAPDGMTYTFHLQPGVSFANIAPVSGRALTSDDVKWTYEYWSRTGQFAGKSLPQAQFDWFFEGMESIQTPDPQTVVLKFKTPFAPFLNYAASDYNPIVPHEIFDQYGNLHDHIVGTGPWQLDVASSQKGSRWVWKRNPSYRERGQPYIDEVDWLVISDDSTAMAAFNAKQLDFLGSQADLGPQQAQTVKQTYPAATLYQNVSASPMHLYMNTRKSPLNDTRVRQAISSSIDRDEIIKTIDQGAGSWALAGAMSDTYTQDEIKQLMPTDVQKAKQLLSAAGYANGVDIDFIVTPSYGNQYMSEAELLQAQLKKAGINLNLKNIDKNTYSSSKKNGSYVMTMTGKDIEGDVDSYLYATFHSGSKDNYAGVNDPKLDQMLEAQRQEIDPTKRKGLVRQAVKYINVDQAYGLALEYPTSYQFSTPALKNFSVQFGVLQIPESDSWLAR
jgi:peptide/nickel transport system substrate-binding protein